MKFQIYNIKQLFLIKNLSTFFYIVLIFQLIPILVSKILQFKTFESISFSLTFILLFLSLISLFFNKIKVDNLFIVFLLLLCISFIMTLVSPTSIDLSYFKSYIIFLSAIIFSYISFKIEPTRILIKWIFLVNIIQSIIILLFDVLGYGYSNTLLPNFYTLGFTNPNLTGMWVFNIITINIILFFVCLNKKKLINAILLFILIISNSLILFKTQNRGSEIAFLFLLATIILILTFKPKKIKFNGILITLIPLLFSSLYLWIYTNGFLNWFSFLSNDGKGLGTRVTIWQNGYELIWNNPILGNYSELQQSNLHNISIDIIAKFGFVTFILFIIFYSSILNRLLPYTYSRIKQVTFLGLVSVFIYSCFEAGLFSGATAMYLMPFSIILIIRYSFK